MSASFYFYDLETSGFNPREARIMQFAGQRTGINLKPLGQPHNVLIKMTDDVIPDPDAVLVTGITPQRTIAEGITEAEFLNLFHEEIAIADTIFVGYNNVRFDDEFMRYVQYRNFYDPYEWQWQNGRSRWDLLDVIRMMRALRPDGLQWPFDSQGQPTNRLELLTSLNAIEHSNVHDALSDVKAMIGLARRMQSLQPKLFDYLLRARDKKIVAALVHAERPFIYTSGKYNSEWHKTTAVATIAEHPRRGVLVFDLRNDPTSFAKLTPAELAEAWQRRWDEPGLHLPVKSLQFNRCPAVAPLSVLDQVSQERLQLPLKLVKENFAKLRQVDLETPVLKALAMMEQARQTQLMASEFEVDAQLYDGFISNHDRQLLPAIRTAGPDHLMSAGEKLKDDRLKALLPLYKARNYPQKLTDEERQVWGRFRHRKLLTGKQDSRLGRYFTRLAELAKDPRLTKEQHYLCEEMKLYGQSIMPDADLES
ncbi:exodeoxyribonuclease I [Candidatus Saccharibacteria bacterium]|nr:exodeoxyribonuclease I [Candidatus Saccharibacteria bacterium]